MINKLKLIFFVLVLCLLGEIFAQEDPSCRVNLYSWDSYKKKFKKIYSSEDDELNAYDVYISNLYKILSHNSEYKDGKVSYRLAPNQFTDLTLEKVQKMFPIVEDPILEAYSYPIILTGESEDLTKIYNNKINVQNQGLKCNSGWAYAAATCFESCLKYWDVWHAYSISAQQLIDCSGGESACRNQNQYTAFKYLSDSHNDIYYEYEYPNTPWTTQGMCENWKISDLTISSCKDLFSVNVNDTRAIKSTIGFHKVPVGLHFNEISFEFLHYSEGIFKPDLSKKAGSHFMAIVGFGKDSKGDDYWKVQNSFGEKWGEGGYIRLPIGSANLGQLGFSLR